MHPYKNILDSFAIGGFKSFGEKVQIFEQFSQVNLFIGPNNCGKSNILRFINDLLSKVSTDNNTIKLEDFDRHKPSARFTVGLSYVEPDSIKLLVKLCLDNLNKVLMQKKALDKEEGKTWFYFHEDKKLDQSNWVNAFSVLNNQEIQSIWREITKRNAGQKEQWVSEIIQLLTPRFCSYKSELIPAIRQVGAKGSISESFSGEGMIKRLAQLQHPNIRNQSDKLKFRKINTFLQKVLSNDNAKIEIPHEEDAIYVEIDDKILPLDSLGTGIHQVIILATAATLLEGQVVCIEEPELHLHPLLQKKLVRYLQVSTNNQYFITTHSAALMDTPGAEIYHIEMVAGQTVVNRALSHKNKSDICYNLGYHPSDLLQANCIIWVEGPSDRIYLNFWIGEHAPELIEGVHYSIMFYGGRLLSHLSGDDFGEFIDDFISLRQLNRRAIIIIDSDKKNKDSKINQTKKRVKNEFDTQPGFAWMTAGREIENYISENILRAAIKKVHPSIKLGDNFGYYDNTLTIELPGNKSRPLNKVKIAQCIVNNGHTDFSILDLKKMIEKTTDFIRQSNLKISLEK